MKLNRIKLLALARKQGFTGTDDQALAWIKSNLSIEGQDGKLLTDAEIDAAWSSKPRLKMADDGDDAGSDDAPAGRKAQGNDDGDTVTITKEEAAQLRELKSQNRRHQRDESDFNGRLAGILEGEKRMSILNSPDGLKRFTARKDYERKANANKTVFATADQAEAFNAHLRYQMARKANQDYKGKQFDVDVIKAWGNTVNELGGVLVPQDFEAVLLYATEAYGVARGVANVVKMVRETKDQPRLTSIPDMAHVAPGGTVGTGDAGTDNVKLVSDKIGLILKFDSEIMEDSAISIGDTAAKVIAEAYNYRCDRDYFLGDGTAGYGGFNGLANALRSGAYISGSGSAWSNITKDDVLGLIGKVENVVSARLMGICSRQFAWQVLKRLDTAANQFRELTSEIGWDGCTWMGYKFRYSQVLPIASASASKCLYFGDFQGGSIFGERRDLRIESSDQVYWSTDQIGTKATARIAVNICSDGRSGTYGNIVALKTT